MEQMEFLERLKGRIREIPDFPRVGILFKDITPLLKDGLLFKELIKRWSEKYSGKVDFIAGIESRGFIFGAPLAVELGIGFIPIRKKGKLPAPTYQIEYQLEYGVDQLEIHQDAFQQGGKRILLVDDLLATGGTSLAAAKLIQKAGGEVVNIQFLIELQFLKGGEKLKREGFNYSALLQF
ncbi:MAG: adenine phosphoribosyltransferase [Campylobacterales bacterium]